MSTEARSYVVVLVQPASPYARRIGAASPQFLPRTQFDVVETSPEEARDLVASWTFDPSRRRPATSPADQHQAFVRWEASFAASFGEGEYMVVVDRLSGRVSSYRLDEEQPDLSNLAWSEAPVPSAMQHYDVRNLDPIIELRADALTVNDAVRDVRSAGDFHNRTLILDADEFSVSGEYARSFITAAFVLGAERIYVSTTGDAVPAFRDAAERLDYGDRVGFWGSPVTAPSIGDAPGRDRGRSTSLEQL